MIRASWASTGLLVCGCLAGVAIDAEVFAAAVGLGLFAVGLVALVAGFAVGVARSREELVTVAGLFWLSGSAPGSSRRHLRWSLAVQVVVSATAAALRPFTGVAFAVLAPMAGLGLMTWWAARHGTFPARTR